MAALSSLLRHYRLRAELTQKELATRIHFHHTVVSRTEKPNGGYFPSEAYIQNFIVELRLNAEEAAGLLQAWQESPVERLTMPDGHPPVPSPAPTFRPWKKALYLAIGLLVTAVALWFGVQVLAKSRSDSARIYRTTRPGELLYFENFDSQNLENWRSLNNGRWEILSKNGNPALGVRNPDPLAIPNAYLVLSEAWTDYALQVEVDFTSGVYEQIYLVVRSSQKENCSGYRVGGNRQGISIFRFDPGPECLGETLAENLHAPLTDGFQHTILVEAAGERIRCYLNGQLVLEAFDDKYPQGGVGLLAYQVQSAAFDNISVQKLGEE
jgi:transcriptional regulator with XRE-family HTH domain